MTKQYTTDELIKAWREGVEGEFICPETTVILTDGRIKFKGSDSPYYITGHDKTLLWTKVQEPVDFMTAINSDKRIKAESYTYYYSPDEWIKELKSISFTMALKLINGKWVIEED